MRNLALLDHRAQIKHVGKVYEAVRDAQHCTLCHQRKCELELEGHYPRKHKNYYFTHISPGAPRNAGNAGNERSELAFPSSKLFSPHTTSTQNSTAAKFPSFAWFTFPL